VAENDSTSPLNGITHPVAIEEENEEKVEVQPWTGND